MSTATRVLIVDDDVPTRVGIKTILSSEPGVEIVGEAATSAQAVERAAALEPDIVLMDVHLPDGNGIDAMQRILADASGDSPAPRVIVLTTFDYDEYVYRSMLAGASGFILKRIRAEELIEAVRTVAHGESLPTPERTRGLIAAFSQNSEDAPRFQFSDSLTPRESEVLALIARGLSNAEIADALALSVETVRTHVKRVYMKTGARDRAHAVIMAYETGLVRPSE